MIIHSYSEIALLALLIDAVCADPARLYRYLPHPVVIIGRIIDKGEVLLNNGATVKRLLSGLLFSVMLIIAVALFAYAVHALLKPLPGALLIEAILASTLLAWRGLFDHVRAVARGLQVDLASGRAALAHIVGRDPERLDRAAISRAAIESSAENFSDGVVAPLFYLLLFGLPGICAYKTINTLDSMIGHHNARFEYFGKCAARIDDIANFIPARISALLFIIAAVLWPKANAARAWATLWRDAAKHRSPNAGWQEAAVAGALGFALAGPRYYGGQMISDAWMGDGRRDLNASDIKAALRLYCIAGALLLTLVLIVYCWLHINDFGQGIIIGRA